MHTLKLHSVNNIEHLESPNKFSGFTVNSSALEIFTDFRTQMPDVVEFQTRVLDAETLMFHSHVRFLMAIDRDKRFLGLLTLNDLDNENLMRYHEAGFNRSEITVADIMTPRTQLRAVTYRDLEVATIQDVLVTLQRSGFQHCLVIDDENNLIRGVFSAPEVARKLHLPMAEGRMSTFADVYRVISKSHKDRKHELSSMH